MKFATLIILVTSFSILFGCTESKKKEMVKTDQNFDVKLDKSEKSLSNAPEFENLEDIVFYNMFSPVDLNLVIDAKSSYFNSAYLNSLNNLTKYTTSHKIALNIGVYGADLSYLWIFDQNQQALSYLSTIQHLTSKLEIPNTFVDFTMTAAEINSEEVDSLIQIAKNAYFETDKYLKSTGRKSYAALILLGGWIETLNIAVNMYSEPNSKLASKILSQKYSLTSLINIVQNSQDDMVMSEYLLLMKKLNDSFKVLESKLKPEDILIDTVNKRITIKDSEHIKIEPEEFHDIKITTAKIREHIIE